MTKLLLRTGPSGSGDVGLKTGLGYVLEEREREGKESEIGEWTYVHVHVIKSSRELTLQ